MVIEIRAFKSTIDGKLFETRLAATLHEHPTWFECPACKGKGHIEEEYNAYPQGLPDSMFATDMQKRAVTCKVCKGAGATPTEKKPVTKIVGYE